MAQTKTSSGTKSSRTRTRSTGGKAKKSTGSSGRRTGGRGSAPSANGRRAAIEGRLRVTSQRLAGAAGRAKTPLIATGAAAAGLAGGAVLAKGSKGPKRALDTMMPNGIPRRFGPKPGTTVKLLGTAAKEAGKAGFKLGELTTEVRKVREGMQRD